MEEQECESCWSQSLCFSHWTRTELRWELPSCFTQCLAKSLCLLIILKYLRSKSVILSVPMASIFLFSFFFKKWLKIAQKSSTCSLIKMQAIKVCDEVKKKIPFPSHHSTLKGWWQLSFLHWCPSFHFQSVDPSWVHIPISVTPRCWFIAIFWYNYRDLHIWDIWNSFG